MSKRALITGITGQDGSYLAELLTGKGYEVHGLCRRASQPTEARIAKLLTDGGVRLHWGDLTDSSALARIVGEVAPDEIYNLAAQSHVGVSFENPEYTVETNGTGVIRLLEAIRRTGGERSTRFYQASTSEMFGKVREIPQRETTPFHPRSPYGVAKLMGHWATVNYRESYGMHASCGILFNHESPRRGEMFVTRKITRAVAAIVAGQQQEVALGNLEAKRDWGHARDFVEGMWLMVQQDQPDDYVLATGETHTVREMTELAFRVGGIDLAWEGHGVEEIGRDPKSGAIRVRIARDFFRPAEVDLLIGDPTKAKEKLGWQPRITFEGLIEDMVRSDMDALTNAR